jgi:hypothetical protein
MQQAKVTIMRMNKFAPLWAKPSGGHIDCGLEPVQAGGQQAVEWFDLDMPEVMTLRQKLILVKAAVTTP